MCGIYGWNYGKGKVGIEKRSMVAAILAIANDTRGGDSWGFWNRNNLTKGLGDISGVAVKTVRSDLIMAHTRKATTGATTVPNAHPFDIGNIIGAHNGCISNHTELNTKYDRKFEVDSMHLFGHIDAGLPFSDIFGYGAIEFIRKDSPGKVYLCKLQAGDLSVCGIGKDNNDYQGVVWSSNGAHLTQALTVAGIEHFDFLVETGKVYYVQNGKYYLDMGEDNKQKTMELGTRTYDSISYNRQYHGGTPRPTPMSPKKITTADYEEMLDGMTNDEEIEFFKTWAKEEGLDEVVESVIKKIENEMTTTEEEEEEGDGTDWGDETRQSPLVLTPGEVTPQGKIEAKVALIDQQVRAMSAAGAEFDRTGEEWVNLDADGKMTDKKEKTAQ